MPNLYIPCDDDPPTVPCKDPCACRGPGNGGPGGPGNGGGDGPGEGDGPAVLPVTSSRFAGTMSGTGGGNSVLLSSGAFAFQQTLLSISAIGSGSFQFGLNYLSGMPGSALGVGFQFPQNVRLSRFSNGDVALSTGAHTTEIFTYDSGSDTWSSVNNNTAAQLTREGSGAEEEFVIKASDGAVSHFWGFTPEIDTPGEIKSFADRFGNTMSLTWEKMGDLAQLTSVTDSYGRVIDRNGLDIRGAALESQP